MRHIDIPMIPQHVRSFCEGELYKYIANKSLVEESRKEIDYVLEEGGNRGFDKIIVKGGEVSAEQQRMLEKIEKITRGREAAIEENTLMCISLGTSPTQTFLAALTAILRLASHLF
jgi:hypothetical protein